MTSSPRVSIADVHKARAAVPTPQPVVIVTDADFDRYADCDATQLLYDLRLAETNALAEACETHFALSRRAFQRYTSGVRRKRWMNGMLFVIWAVAWGGGVGFWTQLLLPPEWLLGAATRAEQWAAVASMYVASIAFILPTYLLTQSEPLHRCVEACAGEPNRWRVVARTHESLASEIRDLLEERMWPTRWLAFRATRDDKAANAGTATFETDAPESQADS